MRELKLALNALLLAVFWAGQPVWAQDADGFSSAPRTNNGAKWRIAYYEGGPDNHYDNYLLASVEGLIELGWINEREVPKSKKTTRQIWDWLAHDAKSDTMEFVADEFYSANWDEKERRENKEKVIYSLNKPGHIDLIIAMGTWAGNDLANDRHAVPTIVMSTSDPLKSGIIKSVEDSGRDHVHARVDPLRYERQVRIFHDIVNFKRLGVAYEDTIYGRSYAAIDWVEKVADERGFEVVKCHTLSDISDKERAASTVRRCFQELAETTDAIYVTVQGGVSPETVPDLVAIANKNRIPTFSQSGATEVESGFLLSISQPGYEPVGIFLAATIGKVFNGAKPRELKQLFEDKPNIAINLKTAEIVGLYLYADILAAADRIYRDIVEPSERRR